MIPKQIKTECPLVAGNIGFGECCNDMPRLFGDSLSSAIDQLIESAMYGYLLRKPTADDLPNFHINQITTGEGMDFEIHHLDFIVGVIHFKHATIGRIATIQYHPNYSNHEKES